MENNINEVFKDAFEKFSNRNGEPTVQEEPAQDAQQETGDDPVEQPQVDEPTPQVETQEDISNKAFAKMRTENTSMSRQLKEVEQFVKAQGFDSIQDFLNKNKEEEVKKTAQQQGIPVDVEKRLRALEEERNRYQQEVKTNTLKQEVESLVTKYNITREGWDNFIQQLQQNDINPLVSNVPLEPLYIQYNMESIINSRISKEKQSWVEEQQRVKDSAPIVTPLGNPPTSPSQKQNKFDFRAMGQNFKR